MELINSINNNEYKTLKVTDEIIKIIKEKLSEEILFVYDEDTNELFLIKKPQSFTDALIELGNELWKDSNATEHAKQERNSWEN